MSKPSLWVGCLFTLLIPFFVNMTYLNELEMLQISEMLFVIIGITTIPNIMTNEGEHHTFDMVLQMPFRHSRIYIIRLFFILIIYGFLIYSLFVFTLLNGSEFNTMKLFTSAFINGLFLGTIGLTLNVFLNQQAIGYLVSFSYYSFELSTRGKFTKDLYLFGLLKNNLSGQYYLLVISMVLLIIQYVYWRKK